MDMAAGSLPLPPSRAPSLAPASAASDSGEGAADDARGCARAKCDQRVIDPIWTGIFLDQTDEKGFKVTQSSCA